MEHFCVFLITNEVGCRYELALELDICDLLDGLHNDGIKIIINLALIMHLFVFISYFHFYENKNKNLEKCVLVDDTA